MQVAACKRQGKKLLEIESQEENDILSELLFSSSRMSSVMDQVWTGGVGSNIARKNVWFWHNNTETVMEFQNWWKGWTGGARVDRSNLDVGGSQAITITRCASCFTITLRPFFLRAFSLNRTHSAKQLTDYYFWQLEQFSTRLPYICEKNKLDIGCIEASTCPAGSCCSAGIRH
jgi:hypothetical protein